MQRLSTQSSTYYSIGYHTIYNAVLLLWIEFGSRYLTTGSRYLATPLGKANQAKYVVFVRGKANSILPIERLDPTK